MPESPVCTRELASGEKERAKDLSWSHSERPGGVRALPGCGLEYRTNFVPGSLSKSM